MGPQHIFTMQLWEQSVGWACVGCHPTGGGVVLPTPGLLTCSAQNPALCPFLGFIAMPVTLCSAISTPEHDLQQKLTKSFKPPESQFPIL